MYNVLAIFVSSINSLISHIGRRLTVSIRFGQCALELYRDKLYDSLSPRRHTLISKVGHISYHYSPFKYLVKKMICAIIWSMRLYTYPNLGPPGRTFMRINLVKCEKLTIFFLSWNKNNWICCILIAWGNDFLLKEQAVFRFCLWRSKFNIYVCYQFYRNC